MILVCTRCAILTNHCRFFQPICVQRFAKRANMGRSSRNPIKLSSVRQSSLSHSRSRPFYLPFRCRFLGAKQTNVCHKIKFVLCSFHMLYTMFIMEYIYFENLHFDSMAILVARSPGMSIRRIVFANIQNMDRFCCIACISRCVCVCSSVCVWM